MHSRYQFTCSNLPAGNDLYDVVSLCTPFGKSVKVYQPPSKRNLAFIQMEDVEAASRVVTFYATTPAVVNGQTVYVKYSDKNEVAAGQDPATITAAGPGSGVGGGGGRGDQSDPGNPPHPGARVLLVTLVDLSAPISLDDIFHIFAHYGPVQKISSFQKAARHQLLIQFLDNAGATNAFANLNCKQSNVCTFQIQWSTQEQLNFTTSDDRNRDYTQIFPTMFGAPPPQPGMGGAPIFSGDASFPPNNPYPSPSGYPSFNPQAPPPLGASPGLQGGPGCVLYVGGLDPEKATARNLLTLFSLYGEVMVVKQLYKKRDAALVQFANPQQAASARQLLDNAPLYGTPINISTSKQTQLTASHGQDSEGMTVTPQTDPNSKCLFNPKNVCPPSTTLHIANIHAEVDRDTLVKLFAGFGTVVAFCFFKTTRKNAMIQFEGLSSALDSLFALNNYAMQLPTGKTCTLKLAFSKHTIKDGDSELDAPYALPSLPALDIPGGLSSSTPQE
eukprot:gene9484-1705_t